MTTWLNSILKEKDSHIIKKKIKKVFLFTYIYTMHLYLSTFFIIFSQHFKSILNVFYIPWYKLNKKNDNFIQLKF